jgi:LemA protein
MSSGSLSIVLLILAGVGFTVLAVYVVALYNSLVQVRNNVQKSFKNIDVLLMQRHDELPKLIDTCKGYMKHESELLKTLTSLRESYSAAGTADEKTRIENKINRQYLALSGRWEAYPDLKAQEGFIHIQKRIAGLESAIADRRELFNDSVNVYNIQIERFPHLMLARFFGYVPKALLEIPEEKKADVKIDFV